MNSTKNISSNNENRFEIILPGNTAKGKNYIINEDCCIRLWSRIHSILSPWRDIPKIVSKRHSFLSLPSPFLPHLEERDPIWGNDLSHSPFIRRSPSWGFMGFSSAVRQMPGDLCTAPRIISLSLLSLATDVTDATLGASGLCLGTRTGDSVPSH